MPSDSVRLSLFPFQIRLREFYIVNMDMTTNKFLIVIYFFMYVIRQNKALISTSFFGKNFSYCLEYFHRIILYCFNDYDYIIILKYYNIYRTAFRELYVL